MIKIWVDDERPMPEFQEYDMRFTSTNEALFYIGIYHNAEGDVFLDLDHDAGEYIDDGGDYINILKALSQPWIKDLLCFTEDDLNENCRGKPWTKDYLDAIKVHFHSANPVGVKNMRAIVEKCPWMEEV